MQPANSLCSKPLLIKQPSDYNLASQEKTKKKQKTLTSHHARLFCLEIIIYLVKSIHRHSDFSTFLPLDSD